MEEPVLRDSSADYQAGYQRGRRSQRKPGTGHPPVQHLKHVHVLALSPETEDAVEKAIDRYTMANVIKGVFRSNVGAGMAIAAILFLLSKFGIPQREIELFVGWVSENLVNVGAQIGASFATGVTEPIVEAAKGANIEARKAWCRFMAHLERPALSPEDFQERLTACDRIT